MTATGLVDRLANHKILGAAPREELEWLAAHGTVRRLDVGGSLSEKGAPVEGLFAILSGRIALFIDRGSGPHKLTEWREGDVTGLLPYSRLVAAPGRSAVQEPAEVLVVPREHVRALARECPELTSILVHRMLDRAREFTSNELHDEKMISLGRLSAGLAHELNNPASAIERSAALLGSRLEDLAEAGRALGVANLKDGQFDAIDAVRNACAAAPEQGVRSPIEHAEREEAIVDWLAGRGLDTAAAEALAETAVTIEALDRLAGAVEGPDLDAALRWAAAGCSRPPAHLGDPGSRDADRGAGPGGQGLHAHGPGDRRGAGGSRPGPRKHGRRSEIEGAREVRRRVRPRGTGSAARARVRRRAEPDLGEPDRQCARRGARVGPRRGRGRPRLRAHRRADRRQRARHSRGDPRPDLRSLLHDEGGGTGDGPRARHRPPARPAQRGRDRRRVAAGPDGVSGHAAGRRNRWVAEGRA